MARLPQKKTCRHLDELPSHLTHITLGSVVERFRGEPELMEWLRVLKLVEEIRSARLRNDELESLIINRKLVATHVFGAMDQVRRGLLGAGAKKMARSLYTNAESNIGLEKSQMAVRDVISGVLRDVFGERETTLRDQAAGR